MDIRFYGVRGSYVVPGKDTVDFGGNTSCISVTAQSQGKQHRLIIDGGSGIIALGQELRVAMAEGSEDQELHILFTHLHSDHVHGMPFFGPMFAPNSKINLYSMEAGGFNVESTLKLIANNPMFPVAYDHFKSQRTYHKVTDKQQINIGPFRIKSSFVGPEYHPQFGCMHYRIEDLESGASLACIWDHECLGTVDESVVRLSEGCDYMIHDTHFDNESYETGRGHGHSTFDMAIANAEAAGIKQGLVCFHYNPNYSDNKLAKLSESLQEKTTVPIIFSKENLRLTF